MVISVTDLCIIHQSAIMMEEITIALSLMMASTIVNVKLTIHVGLMICVHLSNKMRCSSSRINYQIILLKTSAQKDITNYRFVFVIYLFIKLSHLHLNVLALG